MDGLIYVSNSEMLENTSSGTNYKYFEAKDVNTGEIRQIRAM